MTISLRNLPPEVERAILEKSRSDGLSLNKATARLLEDAIRQPERNSEFDEFFGTWSPGEAREFDEKLAQMRAIDPGDWNE